MYQVLQNFKSYLKFIGASRASSKSWFKIMTRDPPPAIIHYSDWVIVFYFFKAYSLFFTHILIVWKSLADNSNGGLPGCCQTVATSNLKLPNILSVLRIFLDCMILRSPLDRTKRRKRNRWEHIIIQFVTSIMKMKVDRCVND